MDTQPGPPERHPTLLVLLNDLTRGADLRDEIELVGALQTVASVVAVAQCYLRSDRALRRLGCPFETYGFAAETYDRDVGRLAARLRREHAPDWVLAYGCANSQLVAALDRSGLPVLAFMPAAPATPDAASQLAVVLKHATGIVLADAGVAASLGAATLSLEARSFTLLSDLPDTPVATRVPPKRRPFRFDPTRLFRPPPTPGSGERSRDVRRVFAFGQALAADETTRRPQVARDAETIHASGLFCEQLALPHGLVQDGIDPVALYLRACGHARPRANPAAGRLVRRPAKGFNPLIYATDAPGFDDGGAEDPLAHFIRMGRKPGRWTHRVLDRDAATLGGIATAAIHVHLHYPDLLPDFLARLQGQRDGLDLFITTTSSAGAATLRDALAAAGCAAKVIVGANRGRDVWPFVELLQTGVFDAYDVVGHFHGKRSDHYALGDLWRNFLWDHLLGGAGPMTDRIRRAFATDPALGLVFAEEPHLEGWDANRPLATELAQRMAIDVPLPSHFEYPMGTMFWARPAALAPLRRLGLSEADIPAEPLPVDGTILHAIECLIPFVVEAAGFRYATTFVEGSVR